MPYSLWDQAQGKLIWDCTDGLYRNWPARCSMCGRRFTRDDHAVVKDGKASNNYVSVFVGNTETSVVIHEICERHGGQHVDCLTGVEIDFGSAKSWPAIWAGNLLDEGAFWLKTAARFAWLALVNSLRIVMHPVRYRRYKQKMREWGMID